MPAVYLSLGANLPSPAGSPEATLVAALHRLDEVGPVIACSSLYSTTPVGYAPQPRFLNSIVVLDTKLAPRELLADLLDLEQEFGRDRTNPIPDGPRTLDLDLILYGDFILNVDGLEIPHPRFAERAFVIVPLAEVAPQLRDPRSGLTVAQLLQNLAGQYQPGDIIPIESALWPASKP